MSSPLTRISLSEAMVSQPSILDPEVKCHCAVTIALLSVTLMRSAEMCYIIQKISA